MKSSQPQQTVRGSFLAQGLAGGALGGFAYVFFVTLCEGNSDFWTVLSYTPLCMVLGSVIGVMEAAGLWSLYHFTGIQMRAAMRASIASVVATLVVVAVVLFEGVEDDHAWLIMTVSLVVPPALIIGSNLRPSELFTFGRLAVRGDGFDELYESRNVWAIALTLPLRFLSLGLAGVLLLHLAYEPKGNSPFGALAIVYGLPLTYLVVSAFLTFRSPGKLLVLFLGIGGNIPVVLGGLLSYGVYNSFYNINEFLILFKICCAFLISWTIFLIARLSVDTSELMPLSILPDKVLVARREDHENCDYWSSRFRRHTFNSAPGIGGSRTGADIEKVAER